MRNAAQIQAPDSTKGQRGRATSRGPSCDVRFHCQCCPWRGLAPAGAGTPCSGFLLRGGLRGTAGPLRLQRPNGMQIGICSHKDILCMDFLLDFTWKLIIHHPSRACTTSGLCQQFLFISCLMPNSSPWLGDWGTPKVWNAAWVEWETTSWHPLWLSCPG